MAHGRPRQEKTHVLFGNSFTVDAFCRYVCGEMWMPMLHTEAIYQRYFCIGCLCRWVLTIGEKTCWSRNLFETPLFPSADGRDRHS